MDGITDTGAQTALGGAGSEGAGQQGADSFLSSLSDENRSFAQEQGFTGMDAVFSGYRDLQGQLGSALKLPGEDATPEQRDQFYQQVTQSWTPQDGYSFAMPEGLPENFPYDQDFAKQATEKFKELGLHPKAAQGLHDWWVGEMANSFQTQNEAAAQAAQKQTEAAEAAHQALVKEYGAPESDGYKNVVAKADRAMTALKGKGVDVSSWFTGKGILSSPDENGQQQVTDATAVKLLSFIYDNALAEDTPLVPGNGEQKGNPFDRNSPNLERQSSLVKSDPQLAKQLIIAAGRNPGLFNL